MLLMSSARVGEALQNATRKVAHSNIGVRNELSARIGRLGLASSISTLAPPQKYHAMRLFAVVRCRARSHGPCFLILQFIVSLSDTEIFPALSRKAFRVSMFSEDS